MVPLRVLSSKGLILVISFLPVSGLFHSWLRDGLRGTLPNTTLHWSAEAGGLSAESLREERLMFDVSTSFGLRVETVIESNQSVVLYIFLYVVGRTY